MNDKENNFFNTSTPLVLDNEMNSNSETPLVLHNEINSNFETPLVLHNEINSNFETPLVIDNEIYFTGNKNDEILKINNLIKKKYLNFEKISLNNKKNYIDKDFISIKNTADKINKDIINKTILITSTIVNHEIELKSLYKEKKLLDQNKIQSDIITNQLILVDNLKKNISKLQINLNISNKKLEENISSNKVIKKKNNELINNVNLYEVKNKNLEKDINKLKNEHIEATINAKQMIKMNDKIKFYQEENIRLSSELNSIKNNYSTIQNNFTEVENQKNNIYKQIKELNDLLVKTNITGASFVKEINSEDTINQKILNDISIYSLKEERKESEPIKNIDNDITDIFN